VLFRSALEVARWFRLSPVELYVTSAAPRVCVPVQSNPCTLLIGSELLGITDDREKLFVLARAFKIAKANLSVVVRSQPQEVVALLGGLVQSYDPHHAPAGADPAHVAEAARRVTRHVPRKAQGELGPLVFEMAGRQGYDAAQLAMAASEWGNRTALVASGSAPAALSALAKLSGERELPTDPAARVALLQRFAEASSLLGFALTDAHFEARKRGGAGQG
jgi:cellulose synthase operon protein C